MAVSINGNTGVITGLAVGGLPDGIVDTDMLAAGAVTAAKRGAGAILQVVQGGSNTVSSASVNAASIWESTGIDVLSHLLTLIIKFYLWHQFMLIAQGHKIIMVLF